MNMSLRPWGAGLKELAIWVIAAAVSLPRLRRGLRQHCPGELTQCNGSKSSSDQIFRWTPSFDGHTKWYFLAKTSKVKLKKKCKVELLLMWKLCASQFKTIPREMHVTPSQGSMWRSRGTVCLTAIFCSDTGLKGPCLAPTLPPLHLHQGEHTLLSSTTHPSIPTHN